MVANREAKAKKLLWALLLIACLFAALFSLGKDSIQTNRQGDAAIFEQLTENIWKGKGAVSNVFAATQNFIERRYVFESTSTLIEQSLISPAEKERNMLGFHAYWIMFVLSPFLYFIESSLLLTLIQTACFLGLILGACYLVKKETKRYSAPLLFAPFVLFSPNWLGGVMGQFYPDRMFIFAAFLLCYLLYYDARPILLLLVAILVASINERAALIGGLICLFIPFCRISREVPFRQYLLPISMGLLLILYAYIMRKFFLSNLYYDGYLPATLTDLYNRFFLKDFAKNSLNFVISNGILIAFSLINRRLGMLALIVMVPNIIGNIGGAEKNGWLTHYHSYYFPVLIFSASVGFSYLLKKYWQHSMLTPAFLMAFVVLLGVWAKEVNIGRLPSTNQLAAPFRSALDLINGRPTGYLIKSQITDQVSAGGMVLTDELGAALLKGHALIDIFPVSTDRADYLLLPCDWIENANGEPKKNSFLSTEWIKKNNFNIDDIKYFPVIARCLLPRQH